MDDIYLIEIRLAMTKWRIRETISNIGRLFAIEGFLELHPHITLFGPFTLNEGVSTSQLIDLIGLVANGVGPIPFMMDGWEMRQGIHGSVIAFPVRPSDPLKKITASIANVLSPLAHSHNIWDASPDSKWFHVTIANAVIHSRHRRFFPCSPLSRRGVPPGNSFSVETALRSVFSSKKDGIPACNVDQGFDEAITAIWEP